MCWGGGGRVELVCGDGRGVTVWGGGGDVCVGDGREMPVFGGGGRGEGGMCVGDGRGVSVFGGRGGGDVCVGGGVGDGRGVSVLGGWGVCWGGGRCACVWWELGGDVCVWDGRDVSVYVLGVGVGGEMCVLGMGEVRLCVCVGGGDVCVGG